MTRRLGIGSVPETPRHQCLTRRELTPLARNTNPDDAIPKGSDTDQDEEPTLLHDPGGERDHTSA